MAAPIATQPLYAPHHEEQAARPLSAPLLAVIAAAAVLPALLAYGLSVGQELRVLAIVLALLAITLILVLPLWGLIFFLLLLSTRPEESLHALQGLRLQLIVSRPLSPALAPLRRVALLAGTVIVSALLGMVLVFGYGLAYPGYAGPGHRVLSVVYDQQAGGAVLWVLVLLAYVTAGVALLIRWLNDEEAQALASGLDRLLKPPKPAWPSRPGLR